MAHVGYSLVGASVPTQSRFINPGDGEDDIGEIQSTVETATPYYLGLPTSNVLHRPERRLARIPVLAPFQHSVNRANVS